MTRVLKARKGGFTLVELLIVIIIIAILAGMLLLTTGAATDRAEATKIINDLRNMKSATLMYYVDNRDWPTGTENTPGGAAGGLIASLSRYMDRSFDVKYTTVEIKELGDNAFGGFTLNDTIKAGVLSKLTDSAKDAGLFDDNGDAYDGGKKVYMSIR